jgi:hypothetical protein
VRTVAVLGTAETVDLEDCEPASLAGSRLYRVPDGRWLAPAFRGWAVDLGDRPLPHPDEEGELSALVLDWVEAVRGHDWSADRGTVLDGDDWLDLRTAMVRVGWGPDAALAAWDACRAQPYSRSLPTAAGWAAAGWVVPAVPDEPDPAFARPVLEARGLLRWTYIDRWQERLRLPAGALPDEPEPATAAWADIQSRLRQDHHTELSLAAAGALAVGVLRRARLGPATAVEEEDDPLPDRHLRAACTHASAVVRQAAWFILHDDAERWLACTYADCQHHWAVEAEEDAYELEEVLELAGRGVENPVDAARERRRLLTLAFGDISDVPLAGAGDLAHFLDFYTAWVARGRPEDEFEAAAEELRGDG